MCLTVTEKRTLGDWVSPGSPRQSEAEARCSGILTKVNPRDRLRSLGKRVADPAEDLAQQATERVVDLVVSALDINEILAHVDLNALLSRIDINALLDQVDVNDLVSRVDIEALVQNTDLGAVIATSTGGVATEVLDAARSQAVGLDQLVDRWVRRLLRRNQPGPDVPPALLPPSVPPPAAVTSAEAVP